MHFETMRYCHRSFVSNNKILKGTVFGLKWVRKFSLTRQVKSDQNCYLLIVGGGAGGCSVAAKFVRKLGKNKVTVIEPGDEHYYQPLFTLVGGGIKSVKESVRPMNEVLPAGANWVQDSVEQFYPDHNSVLTREGSAINYKFMVIACGLVLNYRNVKGLYDALCMEGSGVCSNYTPEFAEKTYKTIKNLKSGKAVFNFPTGPVKCAGAPLKACFISEHYSRLHNTRCNVEFYYKTSLPVIFAVKHYESALMDVCERRNIKVDFQQELVAIKPDKKEAIFRLLDKTFELETINYSMLHVTPPMCTPPELRSARTLTDKYGYLDVDKHTLQHVTYKNIFGLGDCTNLPTSKTAAAAGTQASILYHNLSLVMDDKPIRYCYNGYSSCPLVTEYGKCILAEFDYDHNPIETFPFDQRKERSIAYYVKRDILPQIYWGLGMKGYWNGPSLIRKLTHFGMDGIKIG